MRNQQIGRNSRQAAHSQTSAWGKGSRGLKITQGRELDWLGGGLAESLDKFRGEKVRGGLKKKTIEVNLELCVREPIDDPPP